MRLLGHKISVYSNNLERILQNSMPLDFEWWYNFAQNLSIDLKTIFSLNQINVLVSVLPKTPSLLTTIIPPEKKRFSSPPIKILFWWKQVIHERKIVWDERSLFVLPKEWLAEAEKSSRQGGCQRERACESRIAFLKNHFRRLQTLSSSKTRPCI